MGCVVPILTRLAALLLALVLLTGCGEGYAVEPARLNLVDATEESSRELQAVVSTFLAREGFEDLGRDDEMIALLRRTPTPQADLIESISRRHTYLNRDRGLDVVLTDYSDGRPPAFDLAYTPPTPNFIEISVSEGRPGGASPQGRRFYKRLLEVLETRFGDAIVVVNEPPATNEAEYRRITLVNQAATVASWSVAFGLSVLLTGTISLLLLRRSKLPVLPRRAIFTAVNTWLATPVLMQGGFIFVVLMPNALAFPWTDPDLYSRGAPFHPVSFVCSFLLCAAGSTILLKDTRTPKPEAA
jgi:hypothetical protein